MDDRTTTQPKLAAARASDGKRAKLVLASEALKEDLAPLQPGKALARWIQLGTGIAFALLGAAIRGGIGPQEGAPDPASITFAGAGALTAISILPFQYTLRAALGLFLGCALMFLGLRGFGPLGGLAHDGDIYRDLARLVTMTCLPAALMFRAHYRAYRRARLVLAAALLLSLPFAFGDVLLAADASAPLVARAAAVLGSMVLLCSLFGFMGADTTGAGMVWAPLVLFFVAGSLALREFTPLADHTDGRLLYATTATGMLCTAIVASSGLYQLLAAALATDARAKIPRTAEVETIAA
jgi:hypothetical protein